RRIPRGTGLREGETTTDAILRVGASLSGEVLAIQGPPGSGKTTAAAALIRSLLDAGKKVGVTANSHAVIGNLLKVVGRPALQKAAEGDWCRDPLVRWKDDSAKVAAELADGTADLVGGTAWFWASPAALDAVEL